MRGSGKEVALRGAAGRSEDGRFGQRLLADVLRAEFVDALAEVGCEWVERHARERLEGCAQPLKQFLAVVQTPADIVEQAVEETADRLHAVGDPLHGGGLGLVGSTEPVHVIGRGKFVAGDGFAWFAWSHRRGEYTDGFPAVKAKWRWLASKSPMPESMG